MKKTCATCAHFFALKTQCRRKSPTPMLLGIDPKQGPVIVGAFPAITKDDWCGEHKTDQTLGN